MIESQSGDSLPRRGASGLAEMPELAPIDKGLQDVLLDVEIAVEDRGASISQRRQMLYGLVHAVI